MNRFYIPSTKPTTIKSLACTNITSRENVISRLCNTYWDKDELEAKSDNQLNEILYLYGFAGHINDKLFKSKQV